jgi:hypothetical protein
MSVFLVSLVFLSAYFSRGGHPRRRAAGGRRINHDIGIERLRGVCRDGNGEDEHQKAEHGTNLFSAGDGTVNGISYGISYGCDLLNSR